MRKTRCRWAWVFAAAVLVAAGGARAAEGPVALDAKDAGAVKACIVDLGSADFATREAAQRRLEKVPYTEIETLRKYAGGVSDPEAQARFAAAVDKVEEIGITTAPPISIDVKDAMPAEVAGALSKALNVPLHAIDPEPPVGHVTLHAKDQPYWEIMRQIQAQGGGWDYIGGGGFGDGAVDQLQIVRGAAVAVRASAPQWHTELIHVTAAFDPRIKVLAIQPLVIENAHDDQGTLLQDAAAQAGQVPGANAAAALAVRRLQAQRVTSGVQNSRQENIELAGTQPLGKSISFRVTLKCLIEVSEAHWEIADAGKHVGEAIPLGDSKVTLRGVSPAKEAGTRAGLELEIVPNDSKVPAPPAPAVKFTNGGISLSGNLSAMAGTRLIIDGEGGMGGMVIGAGGAGDAPADTTRILVTDATGKTIANYSVPRGAPVTSIHAVAGDFKEPLKFSFTYPTKTRELSIPFEFKDVPVR